MKPLRILIAGAGDLGTRIASGLRAHGHRVWAIARRGRADDDAIIAIDLAKPITQRLPDRIDLLIHCLTPAARDASSYRAVYVDALAHLLEAMPDTRRVVFVSSTAVYGDHGGALIDESASCVPVAFNGQALLAAESVLLASGRDALVLRLGGIYGPGRDMLLRRVLGAQPLVDHMPPLYSNRIHVDDAANALVHLVERAVTGIVNIVDDAPVAQADVLDWLADSLGVSRLSRVSGAAVAENKRVSNARLRGLGFGLSHADYRSGYSELVRANRGRLQE